MSATETKAPLVPVLKRRVTNLMRLAAVTAIAVVLAGVAVWQRSATGQPDFAPVVMFPSLKANADNVTQVQIETKSASFNVTRSAQGGWTLPDKAGFAADFDAVRKTIIGLADLRLVEQRSERADWHEKLGLVLPKSGGTGTLVTLKDAKGEMLASVLLGGAVEGAAAGGKQASYVRRPNEPQAYVARGNFAPATTLTAWLDKSFIELARDRVKAVAMKPFKGRPYTVARDKPGDENFRIVEAIPAGRILRTPGEPNGVGNALLGISFDDVKPLSAADYANAARAVFSTFDGLTLNLGFIEKDGDYWMSVNAVADPAAAAPAEKPDPKKLKPDIAKEAKELNERLANWSFKLPRYKGSLLTVPLDDLLKPVGSP